MPLIILVGDPVDGGVFGADAHGIHEKLERGSKLTVNEI